GRGHLRPAARAGSGSVLAAPAGGLARRAGTEIRQMIGRLSGVVVEKRGDVVILDVQGVGYLVHLSLQSMSKLPAEGGRAQLRCYTHVRDDALQLFGFVSPEEEELFHLLISVSGVGPKLGINILSGMPAPELATAIPHGELARLTKFPGAGKKTAERLVPELWPEMEKLFGLNGACAGCWCMWWRLAPSERISVANGPRMKHRQRELVKAGASRGVLGFIDGQPVGWCAYAPRGELPRLQRS